ncbi:MAG TPA: hypothetical protein PKM25_12365, partial [Candidatus Ozemobacteraceae bacterium]|nr:hypothetical protein [Candidatus Ozemobacteraceae bacterium]
MKKMLFFLVALTLLVQGFACAASRKDEEEMKKKADELSYMGQLDKANELLGEKTNLASGKAEEGGGWDTTSMVLGLLWGSIGTGYFIYGKKQARVVFLLCGIGLCVFPMFVSGNALNLVLGLL